MALLAGSAILTASAADSFIADGLSFTTTSDSTVMVSYDKTYDEMTSVTVPASVTNEGKTYTVTGVSQGCFQRCEKITAITLPSTITEVAKSSFSGCYALESINLGDTKVTSIPTSCFSACRKLKTITVPATVKTIAKNPFVQNLALKSINVAEGNPAYKSIDGVLFTISGKTLQAYPCGKTTEYTVPEGTDSIGSEAFNTNQVIVSVALAKSVKFIGMSAFLYCDKMTTLTIPEGSQLTKIMGSAFSSCKILTGHLNLPEGFSSLSSNAFNNTSLTEVTIPSTLTDIGNTAFSYCASLTKVNIIGEGLTNIGNSAFASTGLTEFVIPNSVTKLGMTVFDGCKKLQRLTIGSGISNIQIRTFSSCSALKEVTCLNPEPPTCSVSDTYPLFPATVFSSAVLKVPAGSVEAYKAADNWKNFQKVETDNVGIEAVSSYEGAIRTAEGGIMTEGASVEIYTISGQRIYKGNGGYVSLPAKGIYLVRIDGRTHKIVF